MIEHIEYLMLSNDCVVVPGFGAFIAQYKSSMNGIQTSTFIAPKRNISFNASIIHNDGLLANSIAKKSAISYTEALNEIEKSITVCKQMLADGSEIPFGRLGFFISNSEGHMEFIPFHHESANDDFYGLQAFNFPTLEELSAKLEESVEDKLVNSDNEQHEATTARKPNWFGRKVLQIAASIIVLFGLTFALSTPIIVDRHTQQLATMNIPTPKTPKKKVVKPDSSATKQKQEQKAELAQTQTIQEEKKVEQPVQNNGGRYAIIICTLKNQNQVAQYFQNNKDINPNNVIIQNGLYMIYYDRSDNYPELLKEAQQMPQAYSQYWITQV